MHAIPVLPTEPRLALPNNTATNVALVVVTQLPTPSEQVSWEQIIDFRADPDARAGLLGLRRWMRTLDDEKLTINKVHEELEYLLHQYEYYMRLHKMKFEYGLLRTAISFSFEVMENVVKLRLKNATKTLYSVQDRRVALLEAEMSAPGREIAYISRA
jgi:hypothetical protein